MTHDGSSAASPADRMRRTIAERFVQARRASQPLADFPGEIPATLEEAYKVQDLAIGMWPDAVVGWKVGYIAAERRDDSGDNRLLGPMFARALWPARPGLQVPVHAGGFAAIEAEFVLSLDADAPPGKTSWTAEEASQFPAALHIGIEVASSPLATINQLGPRVVIADFGNHNGLVLGEKIHAWWAMPESELTCRTLIDGVEVGSGGATSLPGGLRTAFAFALARSAQRGRPLCKGDLIATGNATGIHEIKIGQTAIVQFAGHGEISCTAVAAR